MKNKKGFAEVIILYVVIGIMALLYIPNPVSSAVGIGIRPNKLVQTEKVEMIKDADGNPIALRTTTKNDEVQQHVTFFEWLRSLPFFVIFLMGLGIIFPPVALFLGKLYRAIKADTKKIVVGVDKAFLKVNDPALKQQMYDEMEKTQDTSTKNLVDKIQGKK